MRRTLLCTAAILAVFTLTLTPRARAADEPPLFGESIDVRVVNVEAVVTDRSGKRVTGLKPGDFRLRVDGKELPIEYFTEVHDGNALPPPACRNACFSGESQSSSIMACETTAQGPRKKHEPSTA